MSDVQLTRSAPRLLAALSSPERILEFAEAVWGTRDLSKPPSTSLISAGLLGEAGEVDLAEVARRFELALDEVRALLAFERNPTLEGVPDGLQFRRGRLLDLPVNERLRIQLFTWIMQTLISEDEYLESEVNEILRTIVDDHVTLRRYLVDYGYLTRDPHMGVYHRGPKCTLV